MCRFVLNTYNTLCRKTFLEARIISHINYCISCWFQANEPTTKPVRSLYKNARKVSNKKPLRDHHCHVIGKYKVLNFNNLIVYSNLWLIFKTVNNTASPLLKHFVQLCSEPTRNSRSVDRKDRRKPKRSSAFGQTAFIF